MRGSSMHWLKGSVHVWGGDTSVSPVILCSCSQAALEVCVMFLKPSDGDYDQLHKMPCSLIISLTFL